MKACRKTKSGISRLGWAISRRWKRWGSQREHGDLKPSIRVPWIAAAILTLQLLKSVQPENFLRHPRLLQFAHEAVSLRVQIRAYVMRHLPSRVTQTDSFIERDSAKPNFFLVIELVPVPEPDVVALARAMPKCYAFALPVR